MERRGALLGIVSAVFLIVVAFARLFLESRMMAAMPGMHSSEMAGMTMHGTWALALQLQIVAAVVALALLAAAFRGNRRAWFAAVLVALVLGVTPALSGHAAATMRFTGLMIAADFLHVIGASTWLGTLFCLMLAGVPIAFSLDEQRRWESISSLVNVFSPLALMSAATVAVSGLFASWVHLERVPALWQTLYGRTLLIKLALVGVTLLLGAYNFRRVQPRLAGEAGVARLRRSATLELSVALLVLFVTGYLTGVEP